MVRWRDTKGRNDLSLEEDLQTTKTIFEAYERDNRGLVLIINVIETMMKQGDNDVGIDGAVPIVRPLSTTTVVDQSASV